MENHSQKLAALHGVNMALSQASALDSLYRLAVELGHQQLGFDRVGLWLYDAAHPDQLHGSYGIDDDGKICDEHHRSLSVQHHCFQQLMREKQTGIYFEPQAELLNQRGEFACTGNLAAGGLWHGRQILGVICTDNFFTGLSIDEQQREILALYAQILANQVSRLRAENNLWRFARQQLLLNEITRAALEENDLHGILQNMVDRLGELFQADSCYLTLWDETNQAVSYAAVFGIDREAYFSAPPPQPGEKNFTSHVYKTRQPLIVPNAHQSSYIETEFAQRFPAQAVLALPLTGNQQFLGAALVTYHGPHEFNRDEIYIGEQAAQNIALAILKTRLVEESQRRATEADTLREAAAALAGTLKRDEVIGRILEQLNRVVPYDSACVLLPDGEEHVIVDARGFANRQEVIGLRFAISAQTPNAVVYAQRKPYIIEDAPAVYDAFNHPPHKGIRGWMGVPLLLHDNMIGMLALDSHRPRTFTADHARLASAFADQVSIALENTRLFEETQRLAITDSLTDLHNRRHFMELARSAFQHARRYQEALSLILFDIDHFKLINDTCGHACGDRVLQTVAQECRWQLRETDEIGRYGGEEFIVLLPRTPARHWPDSTKTTPPPAEAVAQRLRQAIAEMLIHNEDSRLSVTISLGVAEPDSNCPTLEALIERADNALYQAKFQGRNRVCVWQAD
jgi:diguanylate cyclase (GGDEF)-like protein